MAKKRKVKTETAASEPAKTPEPALPSVSTRSLERPAHSIRIVRGRKDAKP